MPPVFPLGVHHPLAQRTEVRQRLQIPRARRRIETFAVEFECPSWHQGFCLGARSGGFNPGCGVGGDGFTGFDFCRATSSSTRCVAGCT